MAQKKSKKKKSISFKEVLPLCTHKIVPTLKKSNNAQQGAKFIMQSKLVVTWMDQYVVVA